jgi:hypothetical protein
VRAKSGQKGIIVSFGFKAHTKIGEVYPRQSNFGYDHQILDYVTPYSRLTFASTLLLLALCFSRGQFPDEDLDNTVRHIIRAILEAGTYTHSDEFAV